MTVTITDGNYVFTKNAKTTPDRFPHMFEHDIMNQIPPEYLIDGWLPEDSTMALYGAPKHKKSFVAVGMVLAITHGLPWCGHAVKQGAVCYVAAEGAGGFGKRIRAWKQHHGITKSSPFLTVTKPVNLTLADDTEKLIRQLRETEQEHGFKFAMVVFDTLARCTAGGEENSNAAMGMAVANMDRVRDEVKCSVLCVHHAGKDRSRGMRGASAIHGAVNTTIFVEQQNSIVSVTLEDQKDGISGLNVMLSEVSVVLPPSNGKPQDSLVLVERQDGIPMSEPTPGIHVDPIHADRVSIASYMGDNTISSATAVAKKVFGHDRHKKRVVDAVPGEWIRVKTASGIRCLRRVANHKGDSIQCKKSTEMAI